MLVGHTFTDALVQRDEVRPGHQDATFLLCLGVALLGLGLAWFAADPIAAWLGSPALALVLPARAASLPASALAAVAQASLTRAVRMKAIAAAETIALSASSLAGIGVAVAGGGIWALVASELVRHVLRAVLLLRFSGWRPGAAARWSHLRELARFNLSSLGVRLLGHVDRMLPRAAIGLLLSETALGFFMIAWRLYEYLAAAFVAPLHSVTLAAAARLQQDLPTLRRLHRQAIELSAFVAYPAFLGTAAIAPWLVPLLFGPGWVDAIPAVQILLLMGVRSAISGSNGLVLRGLGRADLQVVMVAVGVGVGAVLLPLGALHSLEAVALAVVLRGFATWPVGARFVERLTGMPAVTQARAGLGFLLAALGAALLAHVAMRELVPGQGVPLALAASVGAAACAYLVLAAALAPNRAWLMVRIGLAALRRDRGRVRSLLAQAPG